MDYSTAEFATTVRASIKPVKKHRSERVPDESTGYLRSASIFDITGTDVDGT